MFAPPDEIIGYILLFCHEEYIMILSKLSTRIKKLVDDKFWCHLLTERKSYDDYTYCYHYNNDEVHCDKSYLINNKRQTTPDKITANYDTLLETWNIVKTIPSYQDFEKSCKNITTLDNEVTKLLSDLLLCFQSSHHKINLYKKFSSIFGFYQIMLSALNWRETCRYKPEYLTPCTRRTAIFAPFCYHCLVFNDKMRLVINMINVSGPYYYNLFDSLDKTFLISYNNIDYYIENTTKAIIFLRK